jgi:hypothetical protein
MSNVSKEIRALKAKGRKLLKAGLDSEYIAENLRVSKRLVKEWEEEYVKELLADGHGQRVRLRAMLMRMTPTVLMGLNKLASQEIEPRMQLAASQTIVRFGISFMKEDAMLKELEDEAKQSTGATLARETLFDFPDEIAQDVVLRDDDEVPYEPSEDDALDADFEHEPALEQEKTTAESDGVNEDNMELDESQDVAPSEGKSPASLLDYSEETDDDDIGEIDLEQGEDIEKEPYEEPMF